MIENELVETPDEKLKNVIAMMVLRDSYWGYLFSRLKRYEDPYLPSIMAVFADTDGEVSLTYNPLVLKDTSNDSIKLVLEHEGIHVINRHISRLIRMIANEVKDNVKRVKIQVWNHASDCAANTIMNMPKKLKLGDMEIQPCFPSMYGLPDRGVAEFYFDEMMKNVKKVPCLSCSRFTGDSNDEDKSDSKDKDKQKGKGGSSKDKKDEQDKQQSKGSGNSEKDQQEDDEGNCKGKDQSQDQGQGNSSCDCQSGQGENPCGGCSHRPLDSHDEWTKNLGQTSDLNALSRKIDQYVANTALDAYRMVRNRGTIPSNVQEMINELLEPPRVPYYQIIRNLVKGSRFSKFQVAYSRVNKKRTYAFVIGDELNIPQISPFPGKKRDFTFHISILIDTSGSMSKEDIMEALSGIRDIIENDKHCLTHVVECDAQVHRDYVVKRINDICKDVRGRGGTTLYPGLKKCMEHKSDITLVFTDGYCESINEIPKKKLPKKIVWVVSPNGETSTIDKRGFIVRLEEKSGRNKRN